MMPETRKEVQKDEDWEIPRGRDLGLMCCKNVLTGGVRTFI